MDNKQEIHTNEETRTVKVNNTMYHITSVYQDKKDLQKTLEKLTIAKIVEEETKKNT